MKRRQRKQGRGGSKSLVEQSCFIMAVCAYILLCKEALGRKIKLSKNTETKRIAIVTKGITIITGPEDNSCIGNRNMTK